MPQFDISTLASQVFWILATFLLLYVIVLFLIIPTFGKIFSRRKSYISKQIREAELLTKKAEELKKSYEEKIALVKEYNKESIDIVMQEIKNIAEETVEKLDRQFNKELKAYEKEVASFYKSMSTEFEKLTIDTAEDIINKVTNESVNRRKLIKYIN